MISANQHPKRFTLIEMLVVIAIISILASLMLPSIRSAQQIALQANCSNNLKQFSIAYVMYSGDNNEWLPLVRVGNNARVNNWQWQLCQYLDMKEPDGVMPLIPPNKVYICPSQEEYTPTNDNYLTIPTNYAYPRSFGIVGSESWMYPQEQTKAPKRISNFVKPSKIAIMAENQDVNAWFYFYGTTIDKFRHGSGENYLFVDGHSENNMYILFKRIQLELCSSWSEFHEYYR